MFKGMGGIYPDENNPGFKNILLKPNFVVDSFEASHIGPYGTIQSSWKKVKKTVRYTVVIPPNSTATLYLPQIMGLKVYIQKKQVIAKTIQLEAGTYVVEWK